MFEKKSIQAISEALSSRKKIVITTHARPDGDAMGSSLGLYNVLLKLGHEVTVVIPTPFDHFLGWMHGADLALVGSHRIKKARKAVMDAEIIFCLDFGATQRVDTLEKYLINSPALKIMIDHHIDPEPWPHILVHSTRASSTCELVFKVVVDLGWRHLIGKNEASCLYTGIMTDTGSFRFSNTTPEVHRIVAELLEEGIDVGRIHNLVFDNFSEQRTRFIGYVLYQKLNVLPELHTSYFTITQDELLQFNIRGGDTEGLVNYNLSIRGINFGVLIIDRGDKVKLSFRSIGSFPCNEFAAHFNGGGHHNASGGFSLDSLEETEKKFLSLLEQYKDKLSYQDI
ncbi:MAG: DHH family phosphoesterase [Bacteroidia bacterium]|nr:DHH family phosphoesterase [Bacteroidia bacterium]